jgi:drug/metabolite transporter (DMT)-like permease
LVSPRAVGFALVVFAAVTWSLAGLGIKLLWRDALAVAGYRSLFALPIVAAFAHATMGGDRGSFGRAARRPLVWGGAAAYALTVILFVAATQRTTAANAILLQYTAPIYVALLSWPLLRERLRLADFAAIVGCLFGIGWFLREKVSAEGMTGNLLALVSGVGFALLPLLQRRSVLRGDDAAVARISPLAAIVLGNALVVLIVHARCSPHRPPTRGAG